MFDVLAVGELLIDFTPAGVSELGSMLYARNPGGAPANVLVSNSKFGGKTAFIGKVGNDEFGKFLEKTLQNEGIYTEGLLVSKSVNTTLAFVQLNEKGDRSFVFYRKPGADLMLGKGDIEQNKELVSNCKIFHFGSVSLTDDPARTATLYAAKMAKEYNSIISYDPNYRSHLWKDEDLAAKWMLEGLKIADIVKVSLEEMKFLTGKSSLAKGSEILAKYGASMILVTLGAEGSYYRLGKLTGKVVTYDVQVVDTTGAGDAFLGAVHYCLRDKKLKDIKKMTKDEIESILKFANTAGSLTTTKKGAIPALPSLNEIIEYQKKISSSKGVL